MIKIPRGPELQNFDLNAKASIGSRLVTTLTRIPNGVKAPPFIRAADMRASTYKVLGKRIPNSIVIGRSPGVRGTDGMTSHFGNFRNQPDGFLSGLDPQVKTQVKLMPRPDSAIPFMHTKLPQPK